MGPYDRTGTSVNMMSGPGTQKNLHPEHPLAKDSKGKILALFTCSRFIQFVLCVLALRISHPLGAKFIHEVL